MRLRTRIARRGVGIQIQRLGPRIHQIEEAERGVVAFISLTPAGGDYRVAMVKVDKGLQRTGVATKLYEDAARLSCREGRALRSDDARTASTQRFWEKQERKGRATCAERIPPNPAERDRARDDMSIYGRGGCAYYRLPCPAPSSLAGTRIGSPARSSRTAASRSSATARRPTSGANSATRSLSFSRRSAGT